MTRPACVVVSSLAASANLQRVRELAPNSRVMAVLKADAYGHGLARMANALQRADAFGVACLEEAVRLRDDGVELPIVLLEGPFDAAELGSVAQLRLETVVHSDLQLQWLEQATFNQPVKTWLKIDTGMHRLGFAPARVKEISERLQACANVETPLRYMTHLARAHEPQNASAGRQLQTFDKAVADCDGERSIANSAAVVTLPNAHRDWVRPGLMLYGVSPIGDRSAADIGLRPVMCLRSELIAVRQVISGESVGYGADWRAPEPMPVGVVAVGYGDGYPRHAATGTPVLINGVRSQVVGVSSMDMLTVDLRPVANAKVGDPVVLWGAGLPVEEIARHADTAPYELLCGVRVRARYVDVD